jgi:ribonuclease HII
MEKFYLNFDFEIGIDEAGRGPLIGRVYAGAVIWGKDTSLNPIINDSKKISAKKRAKALEWIKSNVQAWGVGWAEPDEVDKINILEATKLAMDRAIQNLMTTFNLTDKNITLIIDGTGWEKKFNNYSVKSIIKGDSKYLSIASASIIAKEYHDQYIKDLCFTKPELNEKYDLLSNMGYGTKKHLLGIEQYGNSEFHRKTFRPCCNKIFNLNNIKNI